MKEEVSKLANGMVGILIVGDLNIWHKRWLKCSPSHSTESDLLYEIACELNMKQLVDKPTHDHGNLLDLVLSSLVFGASMELTPTNADHNGILSVFEVEACTECRQERVVWDYKHADWDRLRKI